MIWLKEHKPENNAKVPPATLIQSLKDAGIFEQILEAAKKAEWWFLSEERYKVL